VLKEGKEPGQGVGNLDDGTMIVVENGRTGSSTRTSMVFGHERAPDRRGQDDLHPAKEEPEHEAQVLER